MVTAAVILIVWWAFCGLYASRIEHAFGDASPTPVIVAAAKGPFALWTALIFSTLTQPAALIKWEPSVTQSAPPQRPALPAAPVQTPEPDAAAITEMQPELDDAALAVHDATVVDATILSPHFTPEPGEAPPVEEAAETAAPSEEVSAAQDTPAFAEPEVITPIVEHEAESTEVTVVDPVPVRVGSCPGCGRRAFTDRYGACAFCGTPLHGGDR